MNHAHTVPPVAVPYTSPENAPDGETGRQPAAPSAPTVGNGVGEKWAVLGEETPAGPLSDGMQAHATASAKNVAIAPRDIRVHTTSIAYTRRAPRRFHANSRSAGLRARHVSLPHQHQSGAEPNHKYQRHRYRRRPGQIADKRVPVEMEDGQVLQPIRHFEQRAQVTQDVLDHRKGGQKRG